MQITYKFRLYPNEEQEQKMEWTLDKCRLVYNDMLEGMNEQEKPDRVELQNSIPELKEKYPELKGVYSKVLQYEVYRLFSNLGSLSELKKKGRKVGKLRFKGKGWFKTFTYNQSGFRIIKTDNRLDNLHLSKIGDVPIRIHREIEGEIKQITIKHKQTGEWFACITTSTEIEAETKNEKEEIEKEDKPIQNPVGIDVGIESFSTDSEGRKIENPRCYKKGLKKLEREQKKLSKKKPKSKNRDKQRKKVAKVHEKIVHQRDDFLHKLSRSYVSNYDLIIVEDLNIKGMNHRLSQSILDCSWSRFIQYLEYKAERADISVIKVNPKNTSQTCSKCRHELEEHLSLSDRTFRCPKCGMEMDRDMNASRNILKRGLEKKLLPQGLREVTPVEIKPLRKLETISASSIIETGSLFQNQ